MTSSALSKIVSFVATLVASAMFVHVANAQDRYPSRPIDFVVPSGPGGGADQVAQIGRASCRERV